MGKLWGMLVVAMASILAWWAWHPPLVTTDIQVVNFSIPNVAPLDAGKWRVVTRRMVWKKAVESMRTQLLTLDVPFTLIRKKEPIELHAFDDARLFSTKREANLAKAKWEKLHIDASVFDTSGDNQSPVYRVELGRYYLSAYAKDTQQQLDKAGMPYRYQKRQVMIPSYRFAFPVMFKSEAEILWRQLQNMGIADPVMMQAVKFNELYSDVANKSAKRSNK
ncbi:MAG: hypothetical protein Q9M18_09270 [Mariprofundaceae bacterium]|nr:hypothetical protein [Mariprofundaceae bacterium]